MIKVTDKPISPELVVNQVRTDGSGCVATYIGLIRGHSQGKPTLSVEYTDPKGTAESRLREIASDIRQKWQLENLAIYHRIGKLKVGEINLVIAIASAHRQEAFAACQYAVDQFKQKPPTRKKETYQDGSTLIEEE